MGTLATAVYRFRTGGSSLNGCGYDPGIGGAAVDYSQQDGAQATWSSGLTMSGTNTLTDSGASGFFTSGMVGNAIRVNSATYWVTGYTDSNTVTVDRTATFSNQAGRLGGAGRQPGDWVYSFGVAGNIGYLRANAGNASSYPTSSLDYTIGAYFTPTAGTASAGYFRWIGENGIPTISTPGLGFFNPVFGWFENLYLVATGATNGNLGVLCLNSSCVVRNVTVNTNLQAATAGINASGLCDVHGCEVYGGGTSPTASSTAYGIISSAYGNSIRGNRVRYMRDAGISSTNGGSVISGNLVYGCVGDGATLASTTTSIGVFSNNTVANNGGHGVNVSGTNGAAFNIVRGNLITGHTGSGKSGINVATSGSDIRKAGWGWNNLYGNTTARTNVTADSTDTALDPTYANAAGGDFTPTNTALYGLGWPLSIPSGGTSYSYPGAVQPQITAGGGGSGGGRLVGDGGGLVGD